MKFISTRELRTNPARIWKLLPKEMRMIVTNRGKPVAMLTQCDESRFEQALEHQESNDAMAAALAMQKHAAETGRGKMTLDEVNAIIRKARQGRRKRV